LPESFGSANVNAGSVYTLHKNFDYTTHNTIYDARRLNQVTATGTGVTNLTENDINDLQQKQLEGGAVNNYP
jgi:hypothetical protein